MTDSKTSHSNPNNAPNDAPDDAKDKHRVGLAIQGGVVPAGAFAAGVIKGLVEEKAFERYDICAFSGTSAGAAIATLCWGHTVKGTIDKLPEALMRQWTYLQWPRHLMWLPIWGPGTATALTTFESLAMRFALWRLFAEHVRTPLLHWIVARWMEDVLSIDDFNDAFKTIYGKDSRTRRPGLVLGAADVLRGEIKTFREDELSPASVFASCSLDEMGGTTTIVTPPHEGTYLDGAWADNPPINELLDYGLDEIWLIQAFPKTIPTAPRTPADRKERKDELWQNSLVEHEREFVEFVNRWRDAINREILAEIAKLQEHKQLPPDDKLVQHLHDLHEKHGKLPQELSRLFDESNTFAPKHYRDVTIKKIEIMMPREYGTASLDAPWFIRNVMHLGHQQALDFVERDFGKRPRTPAGLRPPRWATTPSPITDYVFGVRPARPANDVLELVCDFCPRKAASTAGEMVLGALPEAMRAPLVAADQALCALCPKTLMSPRAA